MVGMIWVVLFVALTGSHLGYGLPVRPTPQTYPHDGQSLLESWTLQGGLYAAIPVLALVLTAIVVLVGCTWCYRHKDCKPNEGADNQLFSASASHLHTARVPAPDSGFSEPVNNNISEDNNNGPISLREMQNIANNNAAAYIVSENEERNRISRESVVEFEPLPLPTGIVGVDPLEHCADWFATEDFPRNSLQYLREIGRGWFGRVVEGEIEEAGSTSTVAVKILNQNASLHDKARFLDEAKMFRDLSHEQILGYLGKCVTEDPWILIFELCSTNLQQYLVINRPHMTVLNESGAPLQLMCDVTSALAHLHSAGYTYGRLWSGSVMVRGEAENARAVLGRYEVVEPQHEIFAPEVMRRGAVYTTRNQTEHNQLQMASVLFLIAYIETVQPSTSTESEIWSLGSLIWEVCSWGSVPTGRPSPPPDLPCPYKSHLYQVMQLCWHTDPSSRPSAAQVHALIQHLHSTHSRVRLTPVLTEQDTDFEERWQRLKPNTIPKVDEHVAIVHAPSTSELEPTLLTVGPAVSRSSSIMSDRDPLSTQIKSESLTNLHGSLEDVRNIYLTHNETPLLECHQGNVLDNERDADYSDASVDPWLKDIIAGSQDDVSYYRDVSDVIKNLDNILNSEKTSSSESSHQASPSRDNLSLDCKKEYPVQSSLVKSPGISNFQNILDTGFASGDQENEPGTDDEVDRDTIGTLSHSFERHSDTTSQQTLENLTPDTPMKDIDIFGKIEVQVDIERLEDDVTEAPKSEDQEPSQTEIESDFTENIESTYVAYTEPESIENTSSKPIETCESNVIEDSAHKTIENEPDYTKDTELPNQIIDSKVPELIQLCKASVPSISETEDQLIVRKDCETSCDNAIRTDKEETKSVVDVRETESVPESMPLAETEVTDLVEMPKEVGTKIAEETILPKTVEDSTASNEGIDTLPSVTDDVSNITQENEASQIKEFNSEDIEPESLETENNYSKDETILVSDLIDTVTDSSKDQPVEPLDVEQTPATEQIPVSVQTNLDDIEKTAHFNKLEIETILPPEIVQNTSNSESENLVNKDASVEEDNLVSKNNEEAMLRSDSFVVKEQSDGSTVYMDLINNTNSQILKDSVTSNNANDSVNEAKTNDNINKDYLASAMQASDASLCKTESTVYLDLPSFEIIKFTDDFLQMERMISSGLVEKTICASTPIASDNSTNNTLENTKDSETLVLSDNKVPDTTVLKEQKSIQENVSPFESPSKSHHTDTYDENSSVVLGPFENEVIKTGKPTIDLVELPKEELLAFSSNFSEINLETPSPLRDGNFLNEVPDIVSDDVQFDDIASISEPKPEPPSDATDSKSGTEKRVSPLTPPNSPGIFLASTSQSKYLVDIDLNNAPEEAESISVQDEIDLNQIELQITSKLAMAENENNLNIEYSGPLTVEGLIEEGEITRDSDAVPEMFLAGNVNGMEDARDEIPLDEECVKALRNELELKLPLAQVAAIEPQCEGEWSSELPPPPELIVSYPGALSPIAEETGQQLSAYENDAQWNASVRTESSSSYPEPCNSQSCTEQPTHEHTYTLPEHENDQRTYTIVKDIATSSREITMSADSLNCSPRKLPKDDVLSPIDDRTYNKDDIVETCERISQVSPFLVSPTTDTSVPSDNYDNATGVSTLSKTTLPTDAKHSKPTETQCLSKATSIDSWCSNDTLYNVEENFDDLAMDPEVPIEFEPNEGNSESTDTLTHNEDEKEHSNCSTYIIHDSKSEPCETFSPDSITANDNYTYTKAKTDQAGTTPSNHTELNDSTKNTQTKDLAYGTMPTFSNCTTEVVSGFEEAWKLPELVRKSPISEDVNISPPKGENVDNKEFSSPQFSSEPTVNRMESIEISCLKDNLVDSPKSITETGNIIKIEDSPNYNYRNMTPSLTSTPLVDLAETENVNSIPMVLPEITSDEPKREVNTLYFENYQKSNETKPQDVVPANELLLLENTTNISAANTTPSYSDFENSALRKPQDLNAIDRTSQMESASSDGFKHFEESVKNCPQDLSSLIDASSRLLESERLSSDAVFPQSLINPPNITYLRESHIETNDLDGEPTSSYLINFGPDDETEQPHSIIVTEIPMTVTKASPNITYDSQAETESNQTYDSHIHTHRAEFETELPKVNGEMKHDEIKNIVTETLANEEITNVKTETQSNETIEIQNITNGSQTETSPNEEITNATTETPNEPEIQNLTNGSHEKEIPTEINTTDKVTRKIANFATVNFLNETFEELIESNVDEADHDKSDETTSETKEQIATPINNLSTSTENVDKPENVDTTEIEPSKTTLNLVEQQNGEPHVNGVAEVEKITTVTEDFLHNEKNYCQLDSYLPLLSDIRFTGPATEIMSTSFTQDSPTSPTSPENESNKPDAATEIMKDWDSDTDSHSSNSSSGEFIWKDGDGHETSVVPSTHFEHQRGSGENSTNTNIQDPAESGERDGASSGSAESGSEGSEVEFVPSSWDCRAAPAKSSLRSVENAQPVDSMSKKRVVFKRQKYHCVYEYPREVNDIDQHSPAYLPDFSTYTEWDPSNAEEAELCYGQLFSSPSALSAGYPLRAGIAFGADYDEDFFISSSARPFESLGIMSTTSQFFPGMHVKPSLLERDLSDDVTEEFVPPPSPLPSTTLVQSRTPSLDFTTPDSGVEDITPGSTTDEDFKKKLPESDMPWRMDSGSSSESVSPSSPGGEALGGLRHTRDKLKLDLPPSPHVPSPRHNRVFNFVLDKPKRRQEDRPPTTPTPLVMTDETPVVATNLPLQSDDEVSIPEPTFSTFGKSVQKVEPEQKIILDEVTQETEHQTDVKEESPKVVEAVKGEGTVLDSGDEDSGIESSSKATLERNKTSNIS